MLQRLFSVLDFVKAGLVNGGLVNQNLANGQFFRYGLAVVIVLALVGCQSAPTQSSRYTQKQDSAPKHVAKKPETLDAVPKYEAYR
ncbi:MAG: septal ring lytic transglycosylase RlpA, partial [Pseudomonadota bacterium]|nr:septal ring lytic transglycosylase RlpA [Pseudomonadota bacterium]